MDTTSEPPGRAASLDALWAAHRPVLVDIAFRMLNNISDAEDVVQEAFTRLLGVDVEAIDDIRAWLVVVVSRLCLDQLRSARSRHSSPDEISDALTNPGALDPADQVALDDAVRTALAVVLERLSPAERTVLVLHDVFQYDFETVASIVGRTPAACRQLASRARRRIADRDDTARFSVDPAEERLLVERFIAACANGDLDGLMAVLDPDVVGDVDLGSRLPARPPLHGSDVIARGVLSFFGPKTGTVLVSQPGLVLFAFQKGRLAGTVLLRAEAGSIVDIHAIADPVKLERIAAQLAP